MRISGPFAIVKYHFSANEGTFSLWMPIGALILSIDNNLSEGPILYVSVPYNTRNQPLQERKFMVVGPVSQDKDQHVEFIGTFKQVPYSTFAHLFEILSI